ncbi:MAG: T9SS type A sorting domain-containing protein [Bacteroidales bacterium]
MRNCIFVSLFMLLITQSHAQINLEQSYPATARIINLTNSGCKYCVQLNETGQVKLYNMDHSLWKTINLDIPSGFNLQYVYHVAELLYSLDGSIACLYTYYQSTPSIQYGSRIINEFGNVLLTIPNAVSVYPYDACDEGVKLIAQITDYSSGTSSSNVYDLPGELLSDVDPQQLADNYTPFPNPTRDRVTIPYSLPSTSSQGELVLWNSDGKEIRRYSIDNTFSTLIINTAELPNGIYFYTTNADGIISKPMKLVVH